MAGDIVVGIGGDGSGTAAALAAARIANFMGRPIVLVFGYEPTVMGGPRGGLREEIEAIGHEATAHVANAIKAQFPDVHVDIELVQQRPVESLIAVAALRDAEVLVVGHGGQGPMAGALLGSITYEIVHRSPHPVLVVPNVDN